MPSDGKIRAFLAVNPPDHWHRELSLRVDPVRQALKGCSALRWAPPHNWHLTLQFLGNWPEARLKVLKEASGNRAAPSAFSLSPRGLGAFPDLRHPRVLFLQLDGGQAIVNLVEWVREAVQEIWPDGPQDARVFRPHLTLARVKGELSAQELARLGSLDLAELPALPVADFGLMGSELTASGARHTMLGSWLLASRPNC
jgi:2'-5' RNA ligase